VLDENEDEGEGPKALAALELKAGWLSLSLCLVTELDPNVLLLCLPNALLILIV
jgi:hypothetical protein